ncbi:endonuclease/exonuclease/phosphatase family protein [Actinoplanes sp. KI2]|uniref:endonuclease/exonuclease/phosphatase family protein n=1 Tax=Actinoplanes sp. KI2 TaxID=2983315 RepID=UPI0021D5D692|nr:endonuclease/exonuclease/phosphatase family protein [Actinoplanes sp. KI2]MCU7725595.1 endonuclease/exonuclease/phosphatase family protein [Actinoplanes sp. KI2]
MIRRESPDLLALQELRGFGRRRIATLADSLGLTAHLAPSVFGQAVAVLVRPPLRIDRARSVTWRLHHAAAAVTVGPLTVVSTHLNPMSGYRRYREATWLAARYRRRGPVLIAGDLNACSPSDDPDPSEGRSDPRAIRAFERAGLVDLWRLAGSGDGCTVPTGGGVGDAFRPMRLDYVFGTPAVVPRVREVRVLRGGEIEYASDHYPVVVELIAGNS